MNSLVVIYRILVMMASVDNMSRDALLHLIQMVHATVTVAASGS